MDILETGEFAREHVRRTCSKTASKILCTDYDNMPRDKQTKHNTTLSMLGAISELTSDRSIKKLTARVEAAGTELTAAKVAMAALSGIS
jgi:hypothetical protein